MRFGLIGCGDIGQLRANALTQTRGAVLVSVSDIDAQKAKLTATRFHTQTDRDWTTLLERSDIDAVIVSTPPRLHIDMCVAAMEAGKHVLCEKPLARTPEECRLILATAERTGKRIATGFNYRFYPSFVRAREILESGRIGELDHVRSYGGYSATSHNQPWVHDAATVGGGALRDIGIHLIDLTRDFLGEVAEVVGMASSDVWKYPGCEDNGFALLRSTSGRIAALHASWTEWRRYQFLIELYGTRGCIRASCFPMMTQAVWANQTGGRTRRRTDWFPGVAVGEKLRSYRWVVVRSFIEEFAAFSAFVHGQPSRIATGFDGMRAIEIANMAAAGLPDAVHDDDAGRGGGTGPVASRDADDANRTGAPHT
ncbi:MAG: Gfo/Idh/MocA family protein [Longimicrobiales bacterium]